MVTASRSFLCIRPATYESASEAEHLSKLYGRPVERMPNTIFTILDPTGKKQLVRAGRSPKQRFDTPADFAEELDSIAKRYEGRGQSEREVPLVSNLRLALNVAAADSLPLVILAAEGEKKLAAMLKATEPLAWSSELRGRMRFVALSDLERLKGFDGVPTTAGVHVVQPDPFGLEAEVLGSGKSPSSALLSAALDKHDPEGKERRDHIRLGKRLGIFWEPVIPVSDPSKDRRR